MVEGEVMTATLFVTGTDTGVGKTLLASAVICAARGRGLRVAPFKPVASGAEHRRGIGLRNDDAEALLAAAGGGFAYEDVNPFCFEPAVAPHLAAQECGRPIDIARLDEAHAGLAAHADLVVVEGAGGWRVPLTADTTFADWVARHRWPVLLVVGMRLGCINHAVLSADAIRARARLAGWVANRIPPVMDRLPENEATLTRMIAEPCLGYVPTGAGRDAAAQVLEWEHLAAVLGLHAASGSAIAR